MKRILLKLLMAMNVLSAVQVSAERLPQQQGCVILLHGLGRSAYSMLAVEWRLAKQGFVVENVSYPSTRYPIEKLSALAIDEGLARCRDRGASPVHFVTHSLGGIVLRQYLSKQSIKGLGRVVMLGPPNQGSQIADQIQSISLLSRLQPPAALQLGTGPGSIFPSLAPVNFELGVIAGTQNARPFVAQGINEPSDGTVSVKETKVNGMKDFLELPVTHTFMMWNPEVLDQVGFFLKKGTFSRER